MTHLTATLLGHFDPGSDEWIEARRWRLGASEIASAMGLSPWSSPFSLWHSKMGSIAPLVEKPEMRWGKIIEKGVAEWYAADHPEYLVTRCGLYVNTERDYQVAQPDRILLHLDDKQGLPWPAETSLLEIKTARLEDKWGKPGTDDIPVYYKCQGLWQLDCLDLDVVHFAVSISGAPPVEYVVTRADEGAHEGILLMREAAEKFIESLKTGEAPDLDGHDATYRAVRELHPEIDGTDVQISAELAAEYRAACEGLAEAAYNKNAASAQIADAMGNARFAKVEDRKIAMRVPNGKHAPYVKACESNGKVDAG